MILTLKICFLALVQGVTEFLPISSSGHLAIFQNIIGGFSQPVALDAALHFGTLLAIFFVFKNDLINIVKQKDWRLVFYLTIATLPAALEGFLLKNSIEQSFQSTKLVASGFIFTGFVLLASSFWQKNITHPQKLNGRKALFIGLGQILALIPGISRSGITISAGLHQKLSPEESYRFSFLLAIPAILGATLLEMKNLTFQSLQQLPLWVLGIIIACFSGILALKFLAEVLKKGRFAYFALYLFILGGLLLALG